MQLLKISVTLLLLAFIFTSCTKESEDSILNKAKEKLDEARKADEQSKPEDAKRLYTEAIEFYKGFLSDYSSSAHTAEVYSTIAKIYSDNLRDYANAVKYYKELSDKYPNTKDAKYAMFMIAFIYDEMLKDKEMAKESYKKFLDKYPKDEDPNEKMSESARMMLQMLQENRSIEDIIKNTQNSGQKTDSLASKDKVKDKTKTPSDTLKKKDNKDPKVPPMKK